MAGKRLLRISLGTVYRNLEVLSELREIQKIEHVGTLKRFDGTPESHIEEIDFDPKLIAYDVCELIKPKTGVKPVEILCRIGDNPHSHVKGDPLRFRQVLTNPHARGGHNEA